MSVTAGKNRSHSKASWEDPHSKAFLGSALNAIERVIPVDNGSVSQDCCLNDCSLEFITVWVLAQNRKDEAVFWFKGKKKVFD